MYSNVQHDSIQQTATAHQSSPSTMGVAYYYVLLLFYLSQTQWSIATYKNTDITVGLYCHTAGVKLLSTDLDTFSNTQIILL